MGLRDYLFKRKVVLDFVVVGVQKAGTSALFQYLSKNNQICVGKQKELHLFDRDYLNGRIIQNFLRAQYDDIHPHQILGEATPIYLFWENSISRLKQHNPKMKIIVVLRNPIDRCFSHYNMERVKNKENRSFSECIRVEINELKSNNYKKHRVRSYISRGLYYSQIKNLLNFFSFENILFLKYEDFKLNQEVCLKKVYSFLNVSPSPFKKLSSNSIPYEVEPMGFNEKKKMIEFYTGEVQKIEELLGWDCSDWLK